MKKVFKPIGDSSNPFTGTFDGRNYTISYLTINRPNTNYVGLFGNTKIGSSIKNVGLKNVDIVGSGYVGGLVGDSSSEISNSYSTGNIKGNTEVGGLIGVSKDSSSEISNSYSNGRCTMEMEFLLEDL